MKPCWAKKKREIKHVYKNIGKRWNKKIEDK